MYADGFVVALNALASLHIVGAILLGLALLRSGLVPRSVGLAMTAAAPVHLASNLAGLLWIDSATWILTAGVGGFLARGQLTRLAASPPRWDKTP